MCDRAGAWGVGGVPSSGGVFFPFLLLACVSKPLRWKGKLGKGKGLLVQWNANMLKDTDLKAQPTTDWKQNIT